MQRSSSLWTRTLPTRLSSVVSLLLQPSSYVKCTISKGNQSSLTDNSFWYYYQSVRYARYVSGHRRKVLSHRTPPTNNPSSEEEEKVNSSTSSSSSSRKEENNSNEFLNDIDDEEIIDVKPMIASSSSSIHSLSSSAGLPSSSLHTTTPTSSSSSSFHPPENRSSLTSSPTGSVQDTLYPYRSVSSSDISYGSEASTEGSGRSSSTASTSSVSVEDDEDDEIHVISTSKTKTMGTQSTSVSSSLITPGFFITLEEEADNKVLDALTKIRKKEEEQLLRVVDPKVSSSSSSTSETISSPSLLLPSVQSLRSLSTQLTMDNITVPIEPPKITIDDEERIIGIAEGDVSLALEIRQATLERRIRESKQKAKVTVRRLLALQNIYQQESKRISEAIEEEEERLGLLPSSSSSTSASSPSSSTTTPTNIGGSTTTVPSASPSEFPKLSIDILDTNNLLVQAALSNLLVSDKNLQTSMNMQIQSVQPNALASRSILPSDLPSLKVRLAVLLASYALSTSYHIPSGQFIGPGDTNNTLVDISKKLGIDLSALYRKQMLYNQKRKYYIAEQKRKRLRKEVSASMISIDNEQDLYDLKLQEQNELLNESDEDEFFSTIIDDSDTERSTSSDNERSSEALSTTSPRKPGVDDILSLLPDPFRGIALPDSILHKHNILTPEISKHLYTDDLVDEEKLPIEIQQKQTMLSTLRGRSELAFAEKLLMQAIGAAITEKLMLPSEHTTRSMNNELPLNLGKVSRLPSTGSTTLIVPSTTTTTASTTDVVKITPKVTTIGKPVSLTSESSSLQKLELEEARDLLIQLGYPVRDPRTNRALVPQTGAVEAIQAFRKKMKSVRKDDIEAYSAARAAVAHAALSAKDGAEMVRILMEDVDKEDALRGEDMGHDNQLSRFVDNTSNDNTKTDNLPPVPVPIGSSNNLHNQMSVPSRPSFVPPGYRNWDEIAQLHAGNTKRKNKSQQTLSAQEQQKLNAVIRLPKPTDGTVTVTPRQIRIAANIMQTLESLLASRIIPDTHLYPAGQPIEIARVEITPDLRKAYIRWRLPLPITLKEEYERELQASQSHTKVNIPSFDSMIQRVQATTKYVGGNSKLHDKSISRLPTVPYNMNNPDTASALQLLDADLRRVEYHNDLSIKRNRRKPKRSDKYAIERQAEIDPRLRYTTAEVWLPQAQTALEKAAGTLKRLVANKLQLRLTPHFEFHYYLQPSTEPTSPSIPGEGGGRGVNVNDEKNKEGRGILKNSNGEEDDEDVSGMVMRKDNTGDERKKVFSFGTADEGEIRTKVTRIIRNERTPPE